MESPTVVESYSVVSGCWKMAADQPERGWAMAAGEIGIKKFVVKLSEAERNHLQGLINKGKSPAKRLLKARILLQGRRWRPRRGLE